MAKNKGRPVYLIFIIISCSYQHSSFATENPFSVKERIKIYKVTRELVGHEEVNRSNSGKIVDNVVNWTGLYKYELRPYCGATIQYSLEKAGFKIPKDVKNPLRARDWFTEDVIYYKGHYRGLKKEEPRLSDLVGFNFYGKNITHVGFYLWEYDEDNFKTFEGNTGKPGNSKIEGFFDKVRRKNITIVRKLRFKGDKHV